MDKTGIGRRSFLKASALFGFKLLAGTTGLASLSGCGSQYEWNSIHYPKVLLDNFHLFDGLSNRLQKDWIVLIEGEKILGVERRGDLTQYQGFRHIDLNGWTLLPGLIDNHVHMTSPFVTTGNLSVLFKKNEQVEFNFRNCIMNGVTTVRDVGGFPATITKFREKADQNQIPGPRVFSSLSMIAAREGSRLGWPVQSPYIENSIMKWMMGGNFAERPQTVDEINDVCEEMIRLGAVWLKTLHHDHGLHFKGQRYPNHTDDGYKSILGIGRKHNIRCAMHAMFVSGFEKGVELGYHTLEHTPMDAVIADRYVDRFNENETAIIPTVSIFGDFFTTRKLLKLIQTRGTEYLAPEALNQAAAAVERILAFEDGDLSEEERSGLLVDPSYIMDMFPNVIKNIEKLKSAGAKIGIGTDSGGSIMALFGFYGDELKYMSSAGISNFEILRMATYENASILNMQDRIGTIEKGKLADIIAIDGNPLIDLESMNNVRVVMKGGAFIKSEGVTGLGV